MLEELTEFFQDNGGVQGTSAVAEYFEVSPVVVSAWAATHDVAVIGRGFAFTLEMAIEFGEDGLGLDFSPDEPGEDEDEEDESDTDLEAEEEEEEED